MKIGASRSSHCSIVPASSCSLGDPLWYHLLAVMFFDRGHPCFRNLNTTIPVDAIRVKSYFDSLFGPTSVPVRILIQIRLWPVSRACSETAEVWVRRSGISLSCLLIELLHRSPCFPDVDIAALSGNPVDNTILFSRVDDVLW